MRTNLFQDRLTSASLSLDLTSLDSNDSGGGTGSIRVDTTDIDDLHLLRGASLVLKPSHEMTATDVYGTVSSFSTTDNASLSVQAETVLNKLNVERTIPPFVGTRNNALTALGTLAGVSFNTTGLPNPNVVWPGYRGSVWTYFKFMLAYHALEATPQNATTIRLKSALRGEVAAPTNLTSSSQSVSDPNLAHKVTVNYYNNQSITNGQVYPVTHEDTQVFQVAVDETFEAEIKLDAWLSSVNQPSPVNFLASPDADYSGTSGVYAVSGSNGLPVTASEWVGLGGKLSVELTDDPSVVKLRIVGPRRTSYTERFSPYSIAETAGSFTHNALRLTGTGVKYRQESIEILTGTDTDLGTDESGATVDNPFISTLGDAYDNGIRTAQKYCGPENTVSVSVPPSATPGDVLGTEFSAYYNVYRTRGLSQSASGADLSLETCTRFSHANTRYTGKTFGQVGAANTGLTFGQFDIIPLRG